jgi:cellulose synthase (UDP-forming)
MEQNPEIAILQTPQYFETGERLTWAARGAAYCQEVFYRVVQPARDYFGNSAICVGTNALYRRQALADIGGFYQAPASEDVHNGVALINQGWKIKYIPILVAKGLCPISLQDLFKQHYRWCSGSMRLFTSQLFWHNKMPTWQKLIYCCGGCYYPATALALPATLIQLFSSTWWLDSQTHWYLGLLLLPKLLLMYLVMPLWNRANWGLFSIKAALTFCWAYLIAIWDLLTRQTEGWIPSGSSQGSIRYQAFRKLLIFYCLAHLGFLVMLVRENLYQLAPVFLLHCFSIYLSLDLLSDRTKLQ